MKLLAPLLAFSVAFAVAYASGPEVRPLAAALLPSPPCAAAPAEPSCDPAPLLRCSARLAAARAPHATLAIPFDAVPDEEQPEAWTEAVEGLLGSCGLAADRVDCSSWPCVGALRNRPGADDSCDPSTDPGQTLLIAPVLAQCGDHTEEVDVVLMYGDDTMESVTSDPDDPDDHGWRKYALLGSRVDAMVRSWPCEP